MFKKFSRINEPEKSLYNNILLLSRNKLFYTKFNLAATFQNRIYLIFIHISFLFIKIKQNVKSNDYKFFYQKVFDLIFAKIEVNMREIGHGDVYVNKNMKLLVKNFYNILLYCENFKEKSISSKNHFWLKYINLNTMSKNTENMPLNDYFNKYAAFCFSLSSDSVLKGEIKFEYK